MMSGREEACGRGARGGCSRPEWRKSLLESRARGGGAARRGDALGAGCESRPARLPTSAAITAHASAHPLAKPQPLRAAAPLPRTRPEPRLWREQLLAAGQHQRAHGLGGRVGVHLDQLGGLGGVVGAFEVLTVVGAFEWC